MTRTICVVLLVVSMVLCSCHSNNSKRSSGKQHGVTIAGSTSVMPFTEKLAEHFMVDHPDFAVDVQGGGSTAGIQACVNKTVSIGMSSRPLKGEERTLREIVICYDGIALVVHPQNPINALSMKQIRAIYGGSIVNWKDLGWVDRKIDVVTREEGSGTRGSFEELVMGKEEIDDAIMVQDSNGSVKAVVGSDPYAVGYISMGLVDDKVRAVAIDGVMPNMKAVKEKRYRIVRPFLFLTNGDPTAAASKFIEFVLSRDGQNLLKKEGLIGVHD